MNDTISGRSAYQSMLARKPVWQISSKDMRMFNPSVLPDSIARGFVLEAGGFGGSVRGGKDMFGIDWEYDEKSGGSMVRPGKPLLSDANEWYDQVVWPDIESWDWEASAEKNRGYLDDSKFTVLPLMTGWFERLISMMDFAGASLALIDEEQTDAVHGFFSKLTDLYIRLLSKTIEVFPQIDGFWIHDDWGGQLNTFFSPETCQEMIVPHMRRLTDFMHTKGKICDFHSCGMLIRQVPNMIAAGWDSWTPQWINNSTELYDLFGDQIIIGITYVWPAADASQAEQLEAVENFVAKFCNPDKPCILNDRNQPGYTEYIYKELISRSRARFAKKVN